MKKEDLGPYACYCLVARSLARSVSKIYDKHLGPLDISATDFSVLNFVRDAGSAGVDELGEKMFMDRTTLLRMLKPLQDKGLLEKSKDTERTRRRLYSISQSGLEKLEEARPAWEQAQAEWESSVGTAAAELGRDSVLRQLRVA